MVSTVGLGDWQCGTHRCGDSCIRGTGVAVSVSRATSDNGPVSGYGSDDEVLSAHPAAGTLATGRLEDARDVGWCVCRRICVVCIGGQTGVRFSWRVCEGGRNRQWDAILSAGLRARAAGPALADEDELSGVLRACIWGECDVGVALCD